MSVFRNTLHIPRQAGTLISIARALLPVSEPLDRTAPFHFSPHSRLVDDFVDWTDGQWAHWQETIPPMLFPYWTMPSLIRCITGRDLVLSKLLNGGFSLIQHRPVPRDQELFVVSQFEGIETLHQHRLIRVSSQTGIVGGETCLETEVRFLLPNRSSRPSSKTRRMLRPDERLKIGELNALEGDGFRFACLTGDFNPIHWIGPVARMFGFKSCIQHGFGTFAKVYEQLCSRGLISSDQIDVSVDFTRPVPLPSRSSLYLNGDQLLLWVENMTKPSMVGILSR